MGKAIRKEKFDVSFLTFEELDEQLNEMFEVNGVVSVGNNVFSYNPKVLFGVEGAALAKKNMYPVGITIEFTNNAVTITKDDMIVIGIEGRPYVMNKKVFELTFEVLEIK